MSESFVTVQEVARRLAVGRTTVYELIARHELVAIRIGRARRIPESALDAWIPQQLTKGEEAVDDLADGGAAHVIALGEVDSRLALTPRCEDIGIRRRGDACVAGGSRDGRRRPPAVV